MLNKILLITYGDATEAATWSNVPFLMTKALEAKGIEIVHLDIMPNRKWDGMWVKYVFWNLNRFFPKHQYSYIRTWINKYQTEKKIKSFILQNGAADYCFFLNFEYYNKYSNIPSLLLNDWTYDIVILDRLKREPYFFEKWFVKYQQKALSNAEVVVSLFEDCAATIKKRNPIANVHHLGLNVVNNLSVHQYTRESILELKSKSNSFLFIGGAKYKEAAQLLIDAFNLIPNMPQHQLNIIGFSREELNGINNNINCFGYLNKNDENDNRKYYQLLAEAKVIINPAKIWAGYSSSVEAMYYYTPVIVSRYESFELEFGKNIDFGFYLNEFEANHLANLMIKLMNHPEYVQLCINAHEKVKTYTWDNYVDQLLHLINE